MVSTHDRTQGGRPCSHSRVEIEPLQPAIAGPAGRDTWSLHAAENQHSAVPELSSFCAPDLPRDIQAARAPPMVRLLPRSLAAQGTERPGSRTRRARSTETYPGLKGKPSVTRSRPTDGRRTSDPNDAGMAIATPDRSPYCMNSTVATWKLPFGYHHRPDCRPLDDLFEIAISQTHFGSGQKRTKIAPQSCPGISPFSHDPVPGRHCSQLAVFDLAGLRESESRSHDPRQYLALFVANE